MNPDYPVYIPSKGRWDSRLTVKALEERSIPYRIVVEPQEYDQYAAVIDPERILTLPFRDQGLYRARCWIMEHSIREGFRRHWQLDDNIRFFALLRHNRKYYTTSGTTFRVIEEWTDQFENVAVAGMQYEMFAPRRSKCAPLILNHRVYSISLIDNRLPFRWRSLYNDDTDLCLQALKAGWCTALFNTFLAHKIRTMTLSGGNTDDLYAVENGRLKMAQALQRLHPDVTTVRRRFSRWQHVVDYRPFEANRLRLRPGVTLREGPNEYGMLLQEVAD